MFHHKSSQCGAAMLIFMVVFVAAASSVTFLLSRSIASDIFTLRSIITSKQAYLTAESALEDVLFRTIEGSYVLGSEAVYQGSGGATTTITYDGPSDTYIFRSVGEFGGARRVSVAELTLGAGTAFNYGLQAGNGGFSIGQNAAVIGNAFANGTITGVNNARIEGDAVSAGPSGAITNTRVWGNAWANTISGSRVDGIAYYNVSGSGNTFASSSSPFTVIDPVPLPIPEAEIDAWQAGILSTGSVIGGAACSSGTYTITGSAVIGNVVIDCNLEISGSGSDVVTLTGPVWARGNIELRGSAIRVASSLGRRSVQLIADNPTNRITSSKVIFQNNTNFVGSGHPASFIMLLSRNNSSALGGSEFAIDVLNRATGAVLIYSNEGAIDIGNNVSLKSVTGHFIVMGNGTDITYDTGLANTLFTGGPGGGYIISAWYQE